MMKDKLLANLKNSYSPYSNYPVSAIVVTKDGREFTGVNVENASYGGTICAERCAIIKAVSEGCRKEDFQSLHLMVGSGQIGMPCFLCRQTISEFFEQDKEIICYSTNGDHKSFKVSDLCPYPFGPEDLDVK